MLNKTNNSQAKNLYYAISNNESKEKLVASLEAFNFYLSTLCQKISVKRPKSNYILQWIFFTGELNDENVEHYTKANLFASQSSLERITSFVQSSSIEAIHFKMITDLVCDLKPFIKHFDTNHDYSWLILNTNSQISNFYQLTAKQLFFTTSGQAENQDLLYSSVPFLIRQSIEYKIKRILGIDYYLKNGKPDIKSSRLFFKIISNTSDLFSFKNFEINQIKNIFQWTHMYIHGGYRAEPWKVENALFYLENFFYIGETSRKLHYSMHASVEVKKNDLELLKKKIKQLLFEEYPSDILEISWLKSLDVAMVD